MHYPTCYTRRSLSHACLCSSVRANQSVCVGVTQDWQVSPFLELCGVVTLCSEPCIPLPADPEWDPAHCQHKPDQLNVVPALLGRAATDSLYLVMVGTVTVAGQSQSGDVSTLTEGEWIHPGSWGTPSHAAHVWDIRSQVLDAPAMLLCINAAAFDRWVNTIPGGRQRWDAWQDGAG